MKVEGVEAGLASAHMRKQKKVWVTKVVNVPECGVLYSKNRNAIDLFNKFVAGGPCLTTVHRVHDPVRKVFLWILSCLETNARLSYAHFTGITPTPFEFRTQAAHMMLHEGSVLRTRDGDPQKLLSHEMINMVGRAKKRIGSGAFKCKQVQRICIICRKKRSGWACKCDPDSGICHSGECFVKHINFAMGSN